MDHRADAGILPLSIAIADGQSKLLKGAVIHADDVLAILGCACAAAGLGVIVTVSEPTVAGPQGLRVARNCVRIPAMSVLDAAADCVHYAYAAPSGADTQIISEIVLFIEKRKGMPRAFRYINEFLMGFCTLLLLAVAIAATVIVVNRQASVTAPGIPSSTISMLLKAAGKSLRYRDTYAYYASE